MSFTPSDVANLLRLVQGQPVPGAVTGIRSLSGEGNNLRNPTWGMANTTFRRVTGARYGSPIRVTDPATGAITVQNLDVNPLFRGLDPRAISNVVGVQDATTPREAVNHLWVAFGQYADHGFDFVEKGGSGTLEIGGPGVNRATDNPADLTRASVTGFDASGIPQHRNKTAQYVDQNQAYGSIELVGTFLRETTGNGSVGARLASGAVDPSNPSMRLLPTLRKLILDHWANNTRFNSNGLNTTFRAYYPGLVSATGVINEAMVPGLYRNFMGSDQPLLLDLNPFISPLDHIVAGDGRVNENITLTGIHTVWARNHNFHVEGLLASGFTGTAEELYQAAKIVNETEYQRVLFTDYTDALLGGLKGGGQHGWSGYNPNADVGISHEFAANAFRFGHSGVPNLVRLITPAGAGQDVPLFDVFLNPTNQGQFTAPLPPGYVPQPGYSEIGAATILRGIANQPSERIDPQVVNALRNDLVRNPADLFSFNVQRGRDLGLGSLNQLRIQLTASTDPYVREAVERAGGPLTPYTSWEDFQARNGLSAADINKLRLAYPDLVLQPAEILPFRRANPEITLVNGNTVKGIDRLDGWVGGLSEQHINGGVVGQTFWVILHQTFDKLQEADRFYYLDRTKNFDFYKNASLADIFQRNTGVHFSESIFFTPTDLVAPTVVSQAPAAGATQVDPNANLTLTFSEAIKRGLGTIELRTAAGVLVETFANTSPRVTITGITVTVDPTRALAGNTSYRLILSSGAVTDLSGNGQGAYTAPAFTTASVGVTLVGDNNANTLTGGALNDILRGLGGADALQGMAGNDSIDGGAGNDVVGGGAGADLLTGGLDRDTFVLNAAGAATNNSAVAGTDVITDFVRGTDQLALSRATYAGFGRTISVAPNQLLVGSFAGGTGFTAVETASTRLVYDRASGNLWHDANGNLAGGFTPIAVLRNGGTPVTTLTTADLTLIA
jgi:Ca2+-binding RTX toxin-like protein